MGRLQSPWLVAPDLEVVNPLGHLSQAKCNPLVLYDPKGQASQLPSMPSCFPSAHSSLHSSEETASLVLVVNPNPQSLQENLPSSGWYFPYPYH